MFYLILLQIAMFAALLGYYGLFMFEKAKPRNIFQQRQYWSYFITGETMYFIIALLTIRL